MIALNKTLLTDLLSQPTAPFKEGYVITFIQNLLNHEKIPYFLDRHQNIVVGASSLREYQSILKSHPKKPIHLFAAHMDHPGFHGAQWISPQILRVKWHGGTPTAHLEGSRIWVETESTSKIHWKGSGRILQAQLTSSGRSLDTADIELQHVPEIRLQAHSLMGGFAFRERVWSEGDLIYTHAADDLVGCFSILSLALQHLRPPKRRKKIDPPFLALLTRAEEVGFIGALAHLELGILSQAKRKVIFVSLETSRTLPGAEIGKGPIVRLGDRFTVFDPGSLRGLTETADLVLPAGYQKRIMDGGSCEATASTAYQLSSIGISIPLGNYHNQSLEGGPDAAPPGGSAPEFVHQHDIQGMITLCEGLIQSSFDWLNPWKSKRKELKTQLKTYTQLLKHHP